MIANAPPQPNVPAEQPSAEPLAALVVSTDSGLQRRLNHYLKEAGYRAVHTCSVDHALALLDSTVCHFLLVDADLQQGNALELCREAGTTLGGAHVAKLLLQSGSTETEFTDLLHAGVDDVLLKPPSYLELLARLRAAARTYEFRRRVELQLRVDPVTHLPNEQMCRGRIEKLIEAESTPTFSGMILTVDHFEDHLANEGARSARELTVAMAELLSREQLENERISHWGGTRFCVVCEGQSASETVARADELCQMLSTTLSGDARSLAVSLSGGVSESTDAESVDEFVEHMLEALEVAQNSGGNCVTWYGEHDEELSELSQLGGTGHLFQSTLAADLMTPCVLTFSESHGIWHAACLLRRHRLSAAPIVDASGKCVGIITASNLPDTQEEAAHKSVHAYRSTFAEMCGEETALGSIMQRLSEGNTRWLVITRHGRPTGTISREQLAAFSHPLTVESLRSTAVSVSRVRFDELLVPEAG